MPVFSVPIRVYYEDTDAAGIVYHANYLKFMERARTEWLRAQGFEQDILAKQYKLAFVVSTANLEFVRPARFNDAISATCRVLRCGRASVEFEQDVVGANEALLCRGIIRVGCVNYQAMAAMRMPAEIYSRLKNAY